MSIEAEQALIGCVLVNNKAFELATNVEPHHFCHPAHGVIYAAMVRNLIQGKAVDSLMLVEPLGEDLEAVGGLRYLTQLMTSACAPSNAPIYANIVLESYRRQQLRSMAHQVIQALDDNQQTMQIVGEVNRAVGSLEANSAEVFETQEMLGEHIKVMESRFEKTEKFIQTGLRDLDKKLGGGFSAGDLVVLAARPSMGKTAMSLSVSLNVAEQMPVLFFSMEMSKAQLMDRAIANVGYLDLGWIRNPDESDSNWARHTQANIQFSKKQLIVSDRPAQKIIDIMATAKKVNRKAQLGLVVVDYLGLIKGGNATNRNLELGEYTKAMKELAKTINCPVLLLAQLNRGVENRVDKRPQMSDLRDSGEIENDADTIMFLYRDEYYNADTLDKGVAEIIIAKQRQGTTGHLAARFQGNFQRFDDMAYEYQRRESEREKPRSRGFNL